MGPLVQAASATNEVEEDALLAEEAGTLLDAAFDDAEGDTDEVALDDEDALLVEVEATRRTILPIRSAPHR